MNDKTNNSAPLRLWYDAPASHDKDGVFENMGDSLPSNRARIKTSVDDDWERWSLPVGNGYFGANVFGRTERERITVAEKTLATSWMKTDNYLAGGLNTFAELYFDFGHKFENVSDYVRELDLKTGVASVKYTYGGANFARRVFASYPDRALVICMTARGGTLDFTFSPTVPWVQEYMQKPGDRGGKTGKVESYIDSGVGCAELSGKMEYYGVDFCGLFRVYCDGKMTAENGKISVSGAENALIILTLDTSYELSEDVFTSPDNDKPTMHRDYSFALKKASAHLEKITNRLSGDVISDYNMLRSAHLSDHGELFGRVELLLDFDTRDFTLTTDKLLEEYKNGSGSRYLEALYFQYGRYLLIASSRKGALPAHLQGVWNKYRQPMWTSGYWHNINVQMNYWPAFSTNISETFDAYIDFCRAYMAAARSYADEYVGKFNPEVFGKDGGNGWNIGTGNGPHRISGDRSAGNIGFTTQLFWDLYLFTKDKNILKNTVYPLLADAARYITKCVKDDGNGHYLVEYGDSPEQHVDGVWYYTVGTTYAQTFAYLNNYHALLAARDAGIDTDDDELLSRDEYSILKTVMEQLDKYDPIIVGLSGQIKEFRQEKYYGDLGEYRHRHISNLVGLYPGEMINSNTPAWLDAAEYTLTERGDEATGWGVAHRLCLWARVKNGERAHDLLSQLLKNNTATNLWDLHPPFQIDGNLGGTAGVAEMLVQSHEGYIEPLAAMPSCWDNGAFSGLLARGNFVVSASWKNKKIERVTILSRAGGIVRVKIGGAVSVRVSSSGKEIESTLDRGVIEFFTAAGEEYEITDVIMADKPEKIRGLYVSERGYKSAKIRWSDSEDAEYYNVYRADNSERGYTLAGRSETNSYAFEIGRNVARATFAVCAVNGDGAESDRSTVSYVRTQ